MEFDHAREEAAREKLLRKLAESPNTKDLHRRLAKCGEEMKLMCIGCCHTRLVRTRCDLKWCPRCQRALAARTTDRYKRVMQAATIRWPLFVTFTCQHDDDDDWNLIRHVRRAHTKLRRLRWFKKAVRGGIVAFEAQNDKGGLHPHAHCLFDCRWLAITIDEPKRGTEREKWQRAARIACNEVADQWSLCLGRKGSVKVRRVWKRDGGDIGGALAEVVKYSVCGTDLAEMPTRQAVELIRVIDRTRMLCSFGSLYRHPAIKREKRSAAMCECGCIDWQPAAMVSQTRRATIVGNVCRK